MRRLLLPLLGFLIGAAPPEVPIGTFQTWLSFKKAPLDVTSAGVSVHVEAMPCSRQPSIESEACRFDGYNNQAFVTVGAHGVVPVTVLTDRQALYVRVAVVRIDRRDPRPGVIIESQYGGSSGVLTLQLLVPRGNSYRALTLDNVRGAYLEGELADRLLDLSGDGAIDLKLSDGGFESVFGCNACTPRPAVFLAVKGDRIVDESRDPGLRGAFAAEMRALEPGCLSDRAGRNGTCAAYVADAARAGRFAAAWRAMVKHYEHGRDLWQPCDVPASAWVDHRCPAGHGTRFDDFPASLRAFLQRAGYLSS